jgi:capsular polysaccharide biosynthesis protein
MDVREFTYPGSLSRRRPPANILPGDEKCFIRELEKWFPPTAAICLHDVVVTGDGLCTIGGQGFPVAALMQSGEATPIRQWVKSGAMIVRRTLKGLPAARSERVRRALLLTDAYFDGFFHWFGDVLPKLEALVRSSADLSEHVILVPASRDAPYVTESLAAYGLEGRVISPDAAVRAEQLCFIPRLAPTGNYRAELMRGIRERMRKRFASSESALRLFVSRKQAPKRRLLNEDALQAVLVRHGFETVCMERLSFSEQVAMATRCEVLAGLHGAGLTHMLWARPNAAIVEVRGAQETLNNCYFTMASDLGCDYYYVPARKCSYFRPSFLSDYEVDVERFESTLEQVLRTPRGGVDGSAGPVDGDSVSQ